MQRSLSRCAFVSVNELLKCDYSNNRYLKDDFRSTLEQEVQK